MTSRLVRRLAAGSLVLALSACGSTQLEGSPASPSGRWHRVPDVPLSARTDPFLAWTGDEVLVIGGNTGWVCPPTASCVEPDPAQFARDGAAWDPDSGAWRPIADLPLPLWSGWSFGLSDAAVLDGHAVVHDRLQEAWLRYDLAADRWIRLEAPGGGFLDLSQDDGTRIWGLRGREVVSWDPVAGDVRVERSYDVSPRLDDPRLLLTDAGPVVTGVRYDDPAPDEPTLAQADLPDGEGWRRVTTGQIGGFHASVAGLVIGPESGGADGGEVNGWDRWYPHGGTLDPRTGEWQPLDVPDPAGPEAQGWPVQAFGDEEIVTGGHYMNLADEVPWVPTGRPASQLDSHLTAVWVRDRLLVWGGVDEEKGFDAPAGPEAWLWAPPD